MDFLDKVKRSALKLKGIDRTSSQLHDHHDDKQIDQEPSQGHITVVSQVQRPAFSNSDILVPTTFGELFDDVLLYIFSFLDLKELSAMTQTNHNLRKLASSDILWEKFYKTHHWKWISEVTPLTHNYRDYFIDCAKKEQELHRKYKVNGLLLGTTTTVKNTQKFCWIGCGPICLWIGIILLTAMAPVFLDKAIPNISGACWGLLVSFLLTTVLGYCCITYGLASDSLIFHKLRQRYWLTEQKLIKSEDPLPNQQDQDLINTSLTLVLGMLWLPLSLICYLVRGALFPNLLFSIALLPVYVCSMAFTCNPLFILHIYRAFTYNRNGSLTSQITMSLLNVMVIIQLILLNLRLDDIMVVSYGVVLIPTWLVFLVFPVFSCLTCILYVGAFNNCAAVGWGLFLMFVPCFMIPLGLFLILFMLRLEEVFFGFSFAIVFIPCFLFDLLVCCCICLCSTISLWSDPFENDL